MANYRIVLHGFNVYAEFTLDADECRGIARALGSHDGGAIEMLEAADAIEARVSS